jgi:hypothetical protein
VQKWRTYTDRRGTLFLDGTMVDCCPGCDHARDEQRQQPELEERLIQWWERRRRGRSLPAVCGSTLNRNLINPCPCRQPFHGS